jgi:phosphoglycerate dehydrogenase-like enzyme
VRSAPRTVLTPHVGYVSRQSYATMYGQAVEDVVAWLDGAPVRVLTPG